ncbi:MAG: PQQ-like beta-propeller repeat protein [Planctomycetes bacterium]|nr:PQQ-like beta-propeller repeat protein [Planctomycetota bacterium]
MTAHLWIRRVLLATLFLNGAAGAVAGGQVRWRFEIPTNWSGKFVGVGADGRVYTTNFAGNLYAISPNGSLIWSLDLGAAASHWPIVFAADGTIYTGVGASGVSAVNADGSLRWAFNTGSWIISGPSIGPDGNIYAVDEPMSDGRGLGFYSLDADGNLRWSDPYDPTISGLYEGLDEIRFGPDRFFAGIHHIRSGPWISTYTYDLDGNFQWTRANTGIGGGPSSNPRTLPDSRLVYRWGQGSLAALNPDGTDDWVVPHPDGAQMLTTPAVGPDGAIYAGDVYGVQLWSTQPDGSTRWILGSRATDFLFADSLGVSPDNRVLIAGGWTNTGSTNVGWFRGYDTADGTLLWQVDLEPEQGLPQFARTVHPAFSRNGDTAYVTTYVAGDGVGHSYLYAISLGQAALSGDVDGDGDVDIADLALLLSAFGSCSGDAGFNEAADFDASGCIELGDLAILLAAFGT